MSRTNFDAVPNGAFFDMPEEQYFAQDALGSTDFAKLWTHKEGYWWGSGLNPHHSEPENRFKARGHALHCRLLEGENAFAMRFAVLPDKADYDGALDTIDDMRNALKEFGAPLPSSGRRVDFLTYCRQYMRSRPLWDDIMSQFQAEHETKQHIDATTARHIEAIKAAIEGDTEISTLIEPIGPTITELSIFWTRPDGMRCRFRFDSLFPDFVVDVKGIETVGNQSIENAIAYRIRDFNLDVQAAISFEARAELYKAIREKRVHGGSKEQRKWLGRFPKEKPPADANGNPAWGWLWLFTQWPNDSTGRAPEIMPVWMKFGDAKHRDGVRKFLHAADTYKAAVVRFGLDAPWSRTHPVHGMQGAGAHQLRTLPDFDAPLRHAGEDAFIDWTVTP